MLFATNNATYRLIAVRFSSAYSASVLLSNHNRKICIDKFKTSSLKQNVNQSARKAAVLIPIYVEKNQVSLLYTRRAANLNTNAGQVCFPGGMCDDGDVSLEQTALRETQEELGIHPKDIDLWGSGTPIINTRGVGVLPVIGCLKPDLPLKELALNKGEVEEVFIVSIERLTQPELCKHTQFRGSYTSIPVYLGGKRKIWGLTAVITYMFLKALLPQNVYAHHLTYIPKITSNKRL